MGFELLDIEILFKCHSAKYLYRNFKLSKMIDINVTEGNYVLFFVILFLLFVISQLLIFLSAILWREI